MKIWIKHNKYFLFLLFLTVVLILLAIFAPLIATFDPYAGNLRAAFQAPDSTYLCGTDKLGRDIFSRILYGIRVSLSVSFVVITAIVLIGGFLGIIAGYMGGILDKIIMCISNVLVSCPSMVLAIALAGILDASTQNAMIAIFVVTVSKYIRLTRSLVIQINNEDYIKSAKMSGSSQPRILWKHVLPNIVQTILVTASTDVGTIILELSALSFLGFGVPYPTPELGYMINEGRSYLLHAPWMVSYPGLALFCIVSILNLLSDKLRDLLS